MLGECQGLLVKGGRMLEAIAILPIIFSFIIPIFFFIVIYGGIIALIVWFIISFLKTQKERNQILQEISEKLTPENAYREKTEK